MPRHLEVTPVFSDHKQHNTDREELKLNFLFSCETESQGHCYIKHLHQCGMSIHVNDNYTGGTKKEQNKNKLIKW